MSTASSSSEYDDDGYYSTSDEDNKVMNMKETVELSCDYDHKDEDEDSEDDDLQELYLSSPLPAPIPTTSKVVHFATLKNEIPMGELEPSETELVSLETMDSVELNDLYKKYDTRLAKSIGVTQTRLSASQAPQSELVSLDTLSPVEMAQLHKNEQTRLSAMRNLSCVRPTSSSPQSELVSLDTLNPVEMAQLHKNEQTRLSAMRNLASKPQSGLVSLDTLNPVEMARLHKNEQTRNLSSRKSYASELVSLDTLSPTELANLHKNEQTRLDAMRGLSSKSRTYDLQHINTLSVQKQEDLFVSSRKKLLSNLKTIDSLTTQGRLALGSPTTLGLKIGGDLDTLSIQELRDLVRECRAELRDKDYENLPVKIVDYNQKPLTQLMETDTRKGITSYTALANPHGGLAIGSVLDIVGAIGNTLTGGGGGGYPYYGGYGGYGGYGRRGYGRRGYYHGRDRYYNPYYGGGGGGGYYYNAQESSPLVNINSLPLEQQRVIREKAEPVAVKSFTQGQGTLSAKKEYELKLSGQVMTNATVNSLFHGLACPVHMNELSFIDHLKQAHPIYDELLRKNVGRRVLDALFNNKERNFIIIVPGKALLAVYRQQGNSLEMAKMAAGYLTVLLHAGEQIPADNKPYSCANLLRDNRITVRRIDDETIEVDNSVLAKLDKASGGHLYTMVEPTIEDLDEVEEEMEEETEEAIVEKVLARIEERQAEEEADTEEEELEMAEEVKTITSPTTIIINTGQTPKMIATLPEANANALAIVPIEEQVMSQKSLLVLSGVYRNTQFKNRKVEPLASKMLSSQYSGIKDMANYIDKVETQSHVSQLLLKTFAYDQLFDKYRATATQFTGSERLTPESSFVLKEGDASLSYNLDASLKMKEFVVDTQRVKISKRQLINHYNVLCFETKKPGQYASLSFSLPDETKSLTDTYITTDENMLLKFKDNLLQSVTINTNAPSVVTLFSPSVASLVLTGNIKNVSVLQNLSVQVPMAQHASLIYAKELSFEQFAQTLLPLSQPSFFKRVRAAFNEFTNAPVLRLVRLGAPGIAAFNEAIATYVEGNERTVDITMAIARGSFDTASTLNKYTYHRMLMRNRDNANKFLILHEYDPMLNGKKEQLSFNMMINTSKATDSPTLSIELLHPLKKKKTFFRFQLASARSPPQTEASIYSAQSSDGLHFDFKLGAQGAKIEEIYVRFFHHTQPSFEQDVTKFLASEAYAYKRLKLQIANTYMTQRMDKYFLNAVLPKEKVDTKRQNDFFANLHKEIERYMEKEKLTALLVNAPSTKITTEGANIVRSSGYMMPQPDELSHFQSLILSGFACDTKTVTTTESVPDVLKSVISEYKTLSASNNVNDLDFALYMDRFKHIAIAMSKK